MCSSFSEEAVCHEIGTYAAFRLVASVPIRAGLFDQGYPFVFRSLSGAVGFYRETRALLTRLHSSVVDGNTT